jgi:hypothetical protein
MGLVHSSAVPAITLFKSATLELYDIPTESGATNDHPVVGLDSQPLAQLLASLQIRSEETGETVYLMDEKAAPDAAEELAHALRRIDEEQDIHMVTFRNVGNLLTARRLATGTRVFFQDGYLNLIFGQVDHFQDEFSNRSREYQPALPGSRGESQLSGGSIQAADWFQFKDGRKDWVLYPLQLSIRPQAPLRFEKSTEMEPQPARPEEPSQPTTTPEETGQPTTMPAQPSRPAEVPPSASQPKTTHTKPGMPSETSTESSQSKLAPAGPGKIPENRWQDLEEGLETLERLRNKKLISEEEFQSKRKILLDTVKP